MPRRVSHRHRLYQTATYGLFGVSFAQVVVGQVQVAVWLMLVSLLCCIEAIEERRTQEATADD